MSRHGEVGSVTAFLAVVAVALVALLGLVVDGGRALARRQALLGEAEQAARAGAAQVSVADLRAGRLAIDPAAATVAATAYLAAAGVDGSVTATSGRVTVQVDGGVTTALLGIVGLDRLTVHAVASAGDVAGTGP